MNVAIDTSLRNLPSLRIVERAVADVRLFKDAASELDRRPPSPEAAERLVAVFDAGAAPPWLTAHLLGCIGDEAGYETARVILLAAPRQLAESYAGVALARIRGDQALEDLCDLLWTAPKVSSREGAAWGLARLGPRAAQAILDATVAGRIPWQRGAAVLGTMGPDPTLVEGLLSSHAERANRVGAEVVACVLRDRDRAGNQAWLGRAWSVLVEPLRRVLGRERATTTPRKRQLLAEWVSEANGPS